MDKKRKNDLPTPTAEIGGERERKKTRRTKAEEVDASSKEPEASEKQLQDFPGKEGDSSEANVKFKMGLGTKRTKKPPKSLENFICRPPIRVSQKPGPVLGDGTRAKTKGSNQSRHPSRNKSSSDSLTTKTSPSTASTKGNPSAPPSEKVSPASDSSNSPAAKKVLPKQTRKSNLKPESTLDESPNATQPQASSKMSVSHRKTPVKQTSPHISAPSSPTPSEQDPSPQEDVKAENTTQQAPSPGSASETKERSCRRTSASPKQTSCLPKSDLKPTVNNTEHLNRKEDEASGSPNSSDSRANGTTNRYQNGSLQKPSPCSSDQPERLPSVQETGSSSPGKCTDNTPESSRGSEDQNEGQNEHEDLGKALEMTMKSSQAIAVLEQQKRGSTEGLPDDGHGKRIKHRPHPEQTESHCLPDSIINPQISPTSAKPSMNGSASRIKKVKKPSKKEKLKHLRCSKIAKMANGNNESPGAGTTVLQASSQKDTPKASPSLQCERKIVAQLPKSKQSKNSTEISSANNPQARKRGRPKVNRPEGLSQGDGLQASSADSTNHQNLQGSDPELDGKDRRFTVARKRGRPKRSFSVQPQSTQPAINPTQQDTGGEHHRLTSEEKVRDTQQKCNNRSSRVMMKTIIRKINKMKVKKKDQVLTQILLGRKQCDSTEVPQEDSGAELCGPVSPDKHSLSSLVTSFGGKLAPQINVSKRGTIYMGKRRGRKPKCERSSGVDFKQIPSPHSRQEFKSSNPTRQSIDSQTGPCSLKNDGSSSSPGKSSQVSLNTQKVKATSFVQLSEFPNSKARCESTFASSTGIGTLDRSARRESGGRLSAGIGFPSTMTTGSVFTMPGLQGSSSLKGKSKTLPSFPSEHLSSAHLPLGSGRIQDSNGAQIASPALSFTNQEAHKFKCHRRGHHCIGRDKLRRHKYKCKKKYMQLRAKRQDPDFLAEVEDLVVRLREIHIVHHVTRARLEDEGSPAGRKSAKSKGQPHDLQCLEQEVHPPTMFQINFSGYYSPHSTVSCDPLRYVRMANMKRKHGCSSEPGEQIVTHFPVMHKLGYPVSGGGFFHPSYKVPFTTASLGFGLYRGYPSTAPLYPSSFPSSYVHHYSKNPIISPSKFHKKKPKVSKQDSGGLWGGKPPGAYPRMTPSFSCDCFARQSWQREKQREKAREGRDDHGRMRGEREQDIEWLLWQNKLSKDKESSRDCSAKPPSSFSVFSSLQNKDKTFPSNLRQMREVRWSEHQPPWRCMRGFESKPGSRSLNREFTPHDHEDTPEGPESDGELTAPPQAGRKTHAFLKKPVLFSNTQSQRKARKRNGVTSASTLLREQDGTSLEDFSSLADQGAGYVQAGSLQLPDKPQLSNSPTARDPQNTQRDAKGHRASRRPLIQDEDDRACVQSLAHFMQEHTQPHFKQPRNTARAKLTQRFRPSKAKSPGGLKVTAGNEVKKRGRGRPRKNPPPSPCRTGLSPSPLFSAPPPLPPPPEQAEKAGKGGSGKRQGDSVLEVIEAVVHREQKRRGRKRRSAEEEEDEGQKVNEGKGGSEISSDLHASAPPTPPSPDQAAPADTEAEAEADSQSEKTSDTLPTKKYLWAGLYSDVYKTEDIAEPQQLSTECLEYNPEEHEHGLLPAPSHVGKYLRLKRIDFQLPYDIHWLCSHSELSETPGSPPPALTCNGSCRATNEGTSQCCADDIRLPDRSNQADVPQLHEEDEPSLQPLQQPEFRDEARRLPGAEL
ncbi:histone-lysine N-methyltransferase ASH1L-like isoform X4 [Salminus brasiliensis]|uniref:histone-lysine N-methyltransferase ASH1L-like isoform X4 n=1 Tax=Salminus brasiliensis TaxID=930266 RepID=UPI003B8348F3